MQDSKLLEAPVRESLAERIQAEALAFAIGECAPEEIDSINIHHASLLSMKRALDALCAKLGCGLDAVVVDGKWIPKGLAYKAQAIVKGDQASFSIACASIVAKVHRDAWMRDLEARYPGYGWAAHKGYPTPQHKKALARLGLTPMHRRSFGPVAAVAQALQLSRG